MSTIFFDKVHAENILQELWRLKENEEFCDVVLIAGAAEKRIPAHRCVLSAASKYFNGMFTTLMTERTTKEVKIASVDGDILQSLIQYCYTGRVSINEDTVVELLETADMVLLRNVVMACENVLIQNLHSSNCLGLWHLAEGHHCKKLSEKAREYSLEHFLEVYGTDEFLSLNVEQLSQLLKDDKLTVSAEEDVFNGLMSWIEHDRIDRVKYKAELLKLVRLPLLEHSFLVERVKPICTTTECLHIYEEADSNKLIKPRKSNPLFMAIVEREILLYYCPQQLMWKKWWENLDYRTEFAISVIEDNYFSIGGQDDEDNYLNTITCVNLSTMTLREINPMTEYRACCRAAVLNGFLYVVGGANENGELSSVEKWNPKTNTWIHVASMPNPRWDFGIGVLNEKLYVVGGLSNYNVRNSVDCYDPQQNMWTTVSPMYESRRLPGVAIANGFMYAVGCVESKAVERYDPETNSWTVVCSLREELSTPHSCTSYHNKVIVCYNDRVDEYIEETNEWIANASLKGLVTTGEIFSYSDKLLTSEFIEY